MQMDNLRGIIHYHADDEYGSIKVKLAEVMDSQGITRNRLRELTGTKYDVITRYYKGDSVQMVDLDFLSKVCYVLNCRIEDLLEYHPPENQER
jgi:putative transcriptional regulator